MLGHGAGMGYTGTGWAPLSGIDNFSLVTWPYLHINAFIYEWNEPHLPLPSFAKKVEG